MELEYNIVEISEQDRDKVNKILMNEWEATDIIVRGTIIDGTKLPGFIAYQESEIIGLITYTIENNECEIVTLNSFKENNGVGTNLIKKVKEIAINEGCTRIKLITTNDNIRAIGFYQKRGFCFSKLYKNAMEESRKLKPGIPMYADNGLPIRDEIEFEIILK